jgi:hypothetical protein
VPLLVVHLVASAIMTGLIWFVQVVHYPLFATVGEGQSVPYAVEHQRRTSWVVALPMAAEGVTALLVFFLAPEGISRWWGAIGLALLAIVLGSTVLLQVPRHARLAERYEERTVVSLVRTNWIRTVGWSARTVLAAGLVIGAWTSARP